MTRTRIKEDRAPDGASSHLKVVDFGERHSQAEAGRRSQPSRMVRRIHLDLPERPSAHLDWIQEKTGALSSAEVIRDALKLYYGLLKEVEGGGSVTLSTGDGKTSELKIFF